MSPRERPPIKLTTTDLGFWRLCWSDYRAALYSGGVVEPTRRAALLWLPRLLFNPSLQFAFLVRIGQQGPSLLLHPVRWLQVVMFGCEIWWFRGPTAIVIGPGVVFPHPINVLIGPGTVIGENVMIYNNTNIGADRHYEVGAGSDDVASRAAHIGDRGIVYAYSVVQGPFNIGEDAVCGLRVILDEDIPPGGLKTQKAMRQPGEWPGARGARWRDFAEDRA